jgi:uncharacterized protein YjbI with pentapeptide repeats
MFHGVNFDSANLSDADLTGAQFSSTILTCLDNQICQK